MGIPKQSQGLTISQAKYYYVCKLLFKLGSTVLEPWMLNLNLKKQKNIDNEKRRIIVTQQAIRQVASLLTDNISNIGVGVGVSWLLKNKRNSGLWGIIAGLAGEQILGDLILRPFVMSKVTAWWEKRYENRQIQKPELVIRPQQDIVSPVIEAPLRTQSYAPTFYPPQPSLYAQTPYSAYAGNYYQPYYPYFPTLR